MNPSLAFFTGEEDLPENIMFIDMSQLMIATISHTFKPEDTITEGMVRHLILDTLRFNVLKFKRDYPCVVLAFDHSRNGYWRRDIAYYYKKNRKAKRDSDPMDWEMIFTYINKIIEEMQENLPYHCIRVDRIEADDIIAVLTERAAMEGREVLIVSGDGDYVQLHKFKNVKQWAPVQKAWKKVKTGSAYKDLMTKLVKGDAGDGIANIKSRSDFVITRIDGERAKPIKTSWIDELCAAEDPTTLMTESEKERFLENKKLIDFTEIPADIKGQINRAFDASNPPGRGRVFNYFMSKGLAALIKKVNDF